MNVFHFQNDCVIKLFRKLQTYGFCDKLTGRQGKQSGDRKKQNALLLDRIIYTETDTMEQPSVSLKTPN